MLNINNIIGKFIRNSSQREIDQLKVIVKKIGFFEEKTKSVDQEEFGSLAIEVYIDLMARIGRYDAAIDATLDLMPKDQPAIGIAPSLYELCDKSGSFDRYLAACKEREDLLGYVAGLIHDK